MLDIIQDHAILTLKAYTDSGTFTQFSYFLFIIILNLALALDLDSVLLVLSYYPDSTFTNLFLEFFPW